MQCAVIDLDCLVFHFDNLTIVLGLVTAEYVHQVVLCRPNFIYHIIFAFTYLRLKSSKTDVA